MTDDIVEAATQLVEHLLTLACQQPDQLGPACQYTVDTLPPQHARALAVMLAYGATHRMRHIMAANPGATNGFNLRDETGAPLPVDDAPPPSRCFARMLAAAVADDAVRVAEVWDAHANLTAGADPAEVMVHLTIAAHSEAHG